MRVGDRCDVREGRRENAQGLIEDSVVSLSVELHWIVSSVITYSSGEYGPK